jgi:hypothetical protein
VSSPSLQAAPRSLVVLTLAVALVLLVAPRPAHAAAPAEIAALTNGEREARGLHALTWSSELARAAQSHAERMAADGELSHSSIGSRVGGWQRIGENVGRASSARQVHDLWMGSSQHRANILDREFTEIGVGAVEADGQLWVVAVYRLPTGATAPAPAPPPEEETPAPPPAPPAPSEPSSAAGSRTSPAAAEEAPPAAPVPDRVVVTLTRIERLEASSRLLVAHPWADAS